MLYVDNHRWGDIYTGYFPGSDPNFCLGDIVVTKRITNNHGRLNVARAKKLFNNIQNREFMSYSTGIIIDSHDCMHVGVLINGKYHKEHWEMLVKVDDIVNLILTDTYMTFDI